MIHRTEALEEHLPMRSKQLDECVATVAKLETEIAQLKEQIHVLDMEICNLEKGND